MHNWKEEGELKCEMWREDSYKKNLLTLRLWNSLCLLLTSDWLAWMYLTWLGFKFNFNPDLHSHLDLNSYYFVLSNSDLWLVYVCVCVRLSQCRYAWWCVLLLFFIWRSLVWLHSPHGHSFDSASSATTNETHCQCVNVRTKLGVKWSCSCYPQLGGIYSGWEGKRKIKCEKWKANRTGRRRRSKLFLSEWLRVKDTHKDWTLSVQKERGERGWEREKSEKERENWHGNCREIETINIPGNNSPGFPQQMTCSSSPAVADDWFTRIH